MAPELGWNALMLWSWVPPGRGAPAAAWGGFRRADHAAALPRRGPRVGLRWPTAESRYGRRNLRCPCSSRPWRSWSSPSCCRPHSRTRR